MRPNEFSLVDRPAKPSRPRYWVKRVIDDPDGGPSRFHIIGCSHRDLMTAYRAAGKLRRWHPEMTFVAGEICIDG